jgi:hypothetical protein
MLNFPGASFPEQAVITKAQALSADVLLTLGSVIDGTQFSFFSFTGYAFGYSLFKSLI